jgi:hypothetical protein
MGVLDRLKHAWNTFVSEENSQPISYYDLGYSSTFRPDRVRFSKGNEKSIVTAIYNRIAIDCSTVQMKHVKIDHDERLLETVESGLNNCLTVEANKDQQSRAFIQDIVMSLFDEGAVAIVPIDTTVNINKGSFDINSMRTGKILQWYPDHVEVEVYNDRKGIRENLRLPKKSVAIIENPHYAVMNEKNSILQRLIMKLNILDVIDQQSGSGKLDLIIQLPYVVKTDARRAQADKRRKDMEDQLTNSKYGIAYTDGTEKITQLNRSVENNLLKQIEYLTSMLNGQLGINESILDGSADETVMLNYMNRTIEPILAAISLEFNRKFLTKTARTQGHTIKYFNDPFRLVTVTNLAEIADKFTRNEIMTSNEMRQVIGMRPIKDPKADELRNKNLNPGEKQEVATKETEVVKEPPITSDGKIGENQNGQ